MKLCFASRNMGKIKELRTLLPRSVTLKGLNDIGCTEALKETRSTLEGNALQKAQYVFDRYQISSLADDTGLEVTALDGAPGVHAARFAGTQQDDTANVRKLLKVMDAVPDGQRIARFRTVIALITRQETKCFEGSVDGVIARQPRGRGGFGYDPVFVPKGYEQSFAVLSKKIKNKISHRGVAVQKLISYLAEQGYS